MLSFISHQKSSKSAQKALSVSPINFTPTVRVPQACRKKQKPQTHDLESHGYHEPLTRGKIFWAREAEETAVNVSV